jgi:hypothetical protein
MFKTQTTNNRLQTGYTLLFAVITASLVLGVAVFILSVSKKQYDLAVTARESMYAIYAADSGIECMATVSVSTTTAFTVPDCAGAQIDFAGSADFAPQSYPTFTAVPQPYVLQVPKIVMFENERCALITIASGFDAAEPTKVKTVVESRGYNQCDANGPIQSTRTVERALRLTYR